MTINKNLIIKCKNTEEVQDCLFKLAVLGYKTYFFTDSEFLFVKYSEAHHEFSNYEKVYLEKGCIDITYNKFLKLYEKQCELPDLEDIITDTNGKIIKVNDKNSDKDVYFYSPLDSCIKTAILKEIYTDDFWNESDFYKSEESCKEALRYKKIENKLRLIAETLNSQIKHMYRLFETNMPKYSISIEYTRSLEMKLHCNRCGSNFIQHQGTIYCLDENFLEVAKKEIGESDLKDYLRYYRSQR